MKKGKMKMLKVNKLDVVVNVNVVLEEYGFVDIDFINDFYKGDGIYEMKIGSRGELESIELGDEYYSKEDLLEECRIDGGDVNNYKEELDEFYNVEYKDEGYGIDILEVGYSEESYSVFFKVKK
jgi:hypothetical protein